MKLRTSFAALVLATSFSATASPVSQAQTIITAGSPQEKFTRNSKIDKFMIGEWTATLVMFGETWDVTAIYRPNGFLELHMTRPGFSTPIIQYGSWSTEAAPNDRFVLVHNFLGTPTRMRAIRTGKDSFDVTGENGFSASRIVW